MRRAAAVYPNGVNTSYSYDNLNLQDPGSQEHRA